MTDRDAGIPWPDGQFPRLSDAEKAASRRALLGSAPPHDAIWIFAYGSLMWDPCFEPAERALASVAGFRRRFAFWTIVARGTPERPGLGLGIEAEDGARCHGVAFRLTAATADRDLEVLWDREMYSGVYRPVWVTAELSGKTVPAITFAAEPDHSQYCPPLTEDQRAHIIAGAAGKFGTCAGYLEATAAHLAEFGIRDPDVEDLLARVRALREAAPAP